MTRPAQPHDAGLGGNRRAAQVDRYDMVCFKTKPAAVRTQPACSGLARGPERLPFTAAIDRLAELPRHLRSPEFERTATARRRRS